MQDLAREITDLLEPSDPAGYRLVVVAWTAHDWVLIFEAKAVALRGGTGFMIRMAESVQFGEAPPPVSEFRSVIAPTIDAFKFAIRSFYNSTNIVDKMMIVMPPGVGGCDRGDGTHVNLDGYSYLELGASDSFEERALSEAIAALTLMRLPDGLAWDNA